MNIKRRNCLFTTRFLTLLLVVAISISSVEFLSASADTYSENFTAVDDAYVRSAKYKDDNYGSEQTLYVKRATAENYRKAFIKFDLSSLGGSRSVTNAVLTLHGYSTTNGIEIGVYQVDNDNWSEGTITWDTAPSMAYGVSTQIGTMVVKNTSSTNYKPFTVDLTDYVAAQIEAGDFTISIGLDCITNDKDAVFSSKNSTKFPAPQLAVDSVESGPRITRTIPPNGNKLFKDSFAYIDFDSDMDADSLTEKSNILIEPTVNYELSYDADKRRCNIMFPDGLSEGEYTITVKASAVKAESQLPLASDKLITFTATAKSWDAQDIILTQHADSAYADAGLTNNKSQPSDATIILALYDKTAENLIKLVSMPYTIDPCAHEKVQTPVIYAPEGLEEYSLKSFLWNDLTGIMPITLAVQADNFQTFDVMRDKRKTLLTGGSYCDLNDPNIIKNNTKTVQNAGQLWGSISQNADRTNLWSTLALGSKSANITSTYRNLKDMAIAYSTIGTELYRDKELLDCIISGLDWMDENVYNPAKGTYDNWWDWQIGAPMALNDTVILIYDELTSEQRMRYMQAVAHFQPDISMTGANRAWECTVFVGRGIISKDSDLFEQARAAFSDLLGMVVSGDGFYEDGSFIQHVSHPYNGGYGKSLFHDVTDLLYMLDRSPWEINEIAKSNVYRWVVDAFEPFIYKGALMDMVRGREISRDYTETHQAGHSVIGDIIKLSQIAPEKYTKDFQRMAKYWIQEDTAKSFFDNATNDVVMSATSILNDASIEPRGALPQYRQFYNIDRAVQIRPGYGVGISMYSTRVFNYEMINSENIKGYHTSDGAVYLYNNDLLQYSDDFWPTINKYRIPGTTVLSGTSVSANIRSDRSWVGGVSLAGLYGVSGMDLHTPSKSLTAKKSWFMFDNEIVALGTGINSTDGISAETIIENRKINGDNPFTVNGSQKPATLGWSETMEDIDWAHLQGNVQGADIGYYFPTGANIQTVREARTGSWRDMRTAGPSTSMTANYLTMWLEHGVDPQNGEYSYVLLPNMTQEQTNSYAQNPDITVIENSENVQAVKDTKQNITGANFWSDTVQQADKITCDKKASVMMKETAEELEISVSDPTQLNTENIRLTINQSAAGIISADENITIEQLTPTIELSINVKGSKGKTYKAKFSLVNPNPEQPIEEKDTYIIDNTDDGFTTDGTPWTVSSTTAGYYGLNAASDNTSAADENRWAKWTPDIREAGTYDVYIRWVAGSNRPDAVPLEIKYNGGIDTSKIINQKFNNGVWVYVGSYPFSEGENGYVKISASDAGYTSADVVKFVARNR